MDSKEDRHEYLQQYKFTCTCVACLNDLQFDDSTLEENLRNMDGKDIFQFIKDNYQQMEKLYEQGFEKKFIALCLSNREVFKDLASVATWPTRVACVQE